MRAEPIGSWQSGPLSASPNRNPDLLPAPPLGRRHHFPSAAPAPAAPPAPGAPIKVFSISWLACSPSEA